MLKNYFKTALRTLLRNKGFSAINIAGLGLGILGCLVIGLFVIDERAYDRFLPGGDQVYRVYSERNDNGTETKAATVAPAFAPFLQQFPEVDTTVRILMAGDKYLVETDSKSAYQDKGWFVESSFFKVFPLAFAYGDAAALAAPLSVVLTRDMAGRFFGKANPVGKTLKIDKETFTVTGVLENLPSHFHLQFQYLMSLPSAALPQERMTSWSWNQFYTYVRLKPGSGVEGLQAKFQAHVKKEIHPQTLRNGSSYLPWFQPLHDIHLGSSDFVYDNAVRGNRTYVQALTIIALFVLVIGCFNFINLATARSFRRAREIGVRKVIGAGKNQLVIQFVGETVMLSLVAVVFAAVATMLVVPYLNAFTGKNIHFNPFTSALSALLVIGAGLVIGILAGIYPAFVLSGFQPVKVLKNIRSGPGSHTAWLRQGLVVVQFALSALLIVAAIMVYRQTHYLNSKDLGFNKEQVVYFQVRGGVASNLETFKNELRRSPAIASVTSGYGLPGDQFAGDGVTVPGAGGGREYPANVFIGDHDFVKTLGLRIIAGRDFSRQMATDVEEAFIINETAARDLGFGSPAQALGKDLHWNKWVPDSLNPVKKGKVIGVVQDFHYKSLHEKVTASVIQIYPLEVFKVAAKLRGNDVKSALAHIEETWNRFSPGYPLDYKFMDESYGNMYRNEEKLARLLWIFTIMAIVVGCLGLFGLAAFSAEQRTKEIGIRKVLGASVASIIGLLSASFLKLVLLASLIAFPVAWYAMSRWLADFPYRVDISWWVFVLAACIACAIALLTVSFQSVRAATANPVNSLRSE